MDLTSPAVTGQTVRETETATLWWREEGFWHFQVKAYQELSGAEVSACFDAIAAVRERPKAPLLIDRTHPYSTEFAGWLAFQQRAPALISAVAFYAPSEATVAAVEYLRDTFMEGWPVGIFQDLGAAEAWLQEHERSRAASPPAPPAGRG